MNPPSSIRTQLADTGRIMRLSAILSGTFSWLAGALGAFLLLFLLDNLMNLPAAIRLPLAVGGAVFLLTAFIRKVARPILKGVSAERTALAIEENRQVGENLLINACQLETQKLSPVEQAFAARAVNHTATVLAGFPARTFWRKEDLKKWGVAAGLVGLVWLVYAASYPRQAWNAFLRYAAPLGDIPPAGSVVMKITPASDLVINEGADLPVSAVIEQTGTPAAPPPPPVIVWDEGVRSVAPTRAAGETVVMLSEKGGARYAYVFRAVQRSFSFRALNLDTYSRSIHVTVLPKPKIKSSSFRIRPPAYTALEVRETPGPPSPVTCLPLSELEVSVAFDQPLASAVWSFAKTNVPLKKAGNAWTARTVIEQAGSYGIEARNDRSSPLSMVAAGEVGLEPDRAPDIDFVTENWNILVAPGAALPITVSASDDYGLSHIVITCHPVDDIAGSNAVRTVKQWSYRGPPGNRGPVRESFTLAVAPPQFVPGEAYLLEAAAADFRPGSLPGKSRPIVVRIKALADVALPDGDVLATAMSLLKRTIAEQRKANDSTDNLTTHLSEAIAGRHLPMHRDRMKSQQEQARSTARETVRELHSHPDEGSTFADRLAILAEYEMGLAITQIGELDPASEQAWPARLAKLTSRQEYILNELIALLGSIANERKPKDLKADASTAKDKAAPPALRDDKAASLADALQEFERAQRDILKNSKTLMDKAPEDLTKEDKGEIEGALAREEAKLAKFLDEKLTDFGKLPLQDFADAAVAKQLNEVIQDVDKAAAALYEKKVEMAVPLEQSGLEKAEELVHNLEKWLSNKPDNIKWSMEEPASPADIPMAELPAELEDITGELLDKEEEMQQDVEDVSSSWLDSMDKGVGWDAADGPISDMSAKGVTGNLLPNQQEIGGRSGEGRSGKSNGQMVQDTAEGKGGRETPTRLTPSPFEPGNVKDSSKDDTGGATGGGKLSGFSGQGLRGPAAPPPPEKLARIAGNQAQIRQAGEALSLKLQRYKLPSGDLEAALRSMQKVETAAKGGEGLRVRRSYHEALDALVDARRNIRAEIGLHREQSDLPESALREIMTGLQEDTPKGYEEVVADYFRRMAGEKP